MRALMKWIVPSLLLIFLIGCIPDQPDIDEPSVGSDAFVSAEVDVGTVDSIVQETADPTQEEGEPDYCLKCHTDQEMLSDSSTDPAAVQSYYVAEEYLTSIHGLNTCKDCHNGVNSPNKEEAHEGLIPNPSKDPEAICGECHPDIVAHVDTNLHLNLDAYWHVLGENGLNTSHEGLQELVQQDCADCHATCGECHVSQPTAAGGGLVNSHLFSRTPPMDSNCLVCHEDRVGVEYVAQDGAQPADLHYAEAGMVCTDCHQTREVHGQPVDCIVCHPGPESSQLPPPDHRYSGPQSPRCESCHPAQSAGEDDVIMHKMHGGTLACQVCHSLPYPNWMEAQVVPGPEGEGYAFEKGEMVMGFLIGRNPLRTYERPYAYVPVRHVPMSMDTFDFLGDDVIIMPSRFQTWEYATPHNIQRNTPQTRTCNACHGNAELFLTAEKIPDVELVGNEEMIVESPPPLIESGTQLPDF